MDSLFSGVKSSGGASSGAGRSKTPSRSRGGSPSGGASSGAGRSKTPKRVRIRTRGSRGKGSSGGSAVPASTVAASTAEPVDYDKLASMVAAKLQSSSAKSSGGGTAESKTSAPSSKGGRFAAAAESKTSAPSSKGGRFAAAAESKTSAPSSKGCRFAAAAKPKSLLKGAFSGTPFASKTEEELRQILKQFGVGKKTMELLLNSSNGKMNCKTKFFLLAVVQRLLREGKRDDVIAAVVAVFCFDGQYKDALTSNRNLDKSVSDVLEALYGGKGLLENCRDEFEKAELSRDKLKTAAARPNINTADELITSYAGMRD